MVVDNYVERTAARLLRLLRRSGSIPLHRIQFSNSIIQYLLDRNLAQIDNTGCGFSLSVIAGKK